MLISTKQVYDLRAFVNYLDIAIIYSFTHFTKNTIDIEIHQKCPANSSLSLIEMVN
jgi:hypothetical protein